VDLAVLCGCNSVCICGPVVSKLWNHLGFSNVLILGANPGCWNCLGGFGDLNSESHAFYAGILPLEPLCQAYFMLSFLEIGSPELLEISLRYCVMRKMTQLRSQ
jgi:hypothetical protein